MDKRIEKKKWNTKRSAIIALGGLILIISTTLALNSGTTAKSVDRSRLRLSVVQEGLFVHSISLTATVEPEVTVMLDAVEGGTVVEKFVEAGEQVVKGQELLRLSNTNLTLDFMNRETQIIEQINNLRNTRIQMELNEQNLKEQKLDLEYELAEIKRNFQIQETLHQDSAIASNDFETTRQRFTYLADKYQLVEKNLKQSASYRNLQLKRIDHSIELMERNLKAIRSNLEHLVVKAPLSGQLTSLNAEIGESKMKGVNLGRIDQLDQYKLSSLVDEHFLNKINPGLKGHFELNHQRIQVTVTKVFPEVVNNQFKVELSFDSSLSELPLKRGQNVNLELALSHPKEALIVDRGAFYTTSGGQWAYVLTDDQTAEKRAISLGLQNTDQIEIKEGLEPGETIIISSYGTFGDVDQLILE